MKCKGAENHFPNGSLEDDLSAIRPYLGRMPVSMPSDDFFEQTRSLCHARLKRSSIPRFIWAALAALLILTAILMLPLAKEIMVDRPLSFPALGVLILVIQNLLMLFFAPVLIQKFRLRKRDPINDFTDKEVCHG